MTREYSGIFLKVILVSEKPIKSSILDLETDFEISDPSKLLLFLHNSLFSILNFQIRIVEKVAMDHTDHFDFRQTIVVTR